MAARHTDNRSGTTALLRELADSGAHLVRQEARLARLEVGSAARWIGVGTAQVALGGVLVFLGALALFTGVILLAGDQWLRDRYWLAALLVALVVGGGGAWPGGRGPAPPAPGRPKPRPTAQTLKEDKEWLKRQLTSGATSS